MLAYTRFELVRALRNARYLAFLLVLPPVLYVVATPSGTPPVNGMVAMTVYAAAAAAMIGAGGTLAEDRGTGWVRQLRVTPLRDPQWLGGKLVQALLLTLPGTAAVCLTAVLADGVHLPVLGWAELAGVVLLGCVPLALTGLLIGLLLTGRTANIGIMMVFVLMFFAGVVGTRPGTPEAVAAVGHLLPTAGLTDAALAVAAGGPLSLADVVAPLVWSVLAGAAVLFRWARATDSR